MEELTFESAIKESVESWSGTNRRSGTKNTWSANGTWRVVVRNDVKKKKQMWLEMILHDNMKTELLQSL